MDGNKSETDSVYEQDDDELENENNLQQSFMELCIEQKQKSVAQPLYEAELPKSMELMFILFSFYREDLMGIGFDFNCKVKLSLNKIKISSDASMEDVDKCMTKITNYMQRLSYTELYHQSKFKILYSPYFKQKSQLKGFRLCKFNQIIYCHSNKMNEKDLKISMKEVFSGQYIFTVSIKSRKSKDRDIYAYLKDFIKKMRQYYTKDITQRGVIVELDNTDTMINVIGTKQRDLVAVKNIFKNLLEGTVILIIRFENSEQIDKKVRDLKAYVKKKSAFPVCVAKVQKRAMTMISKQNVVKKLLENAKTQQILKINEKTDLGMFLPRRYNYLQRKIMIEQLCTKKGYDFTTLGGVYFYFKKMFIHDDQKIDTEEVLSLIYEVLEAIKDNKDKFEIPQKLKQKIIMNTFAEVTEGEYYSASDIVPDNELSKILKRNVLKEKLKMSKPSLVKYRICDAPESQVYWYINSDNKKVKCQINEMEHGRDYFCGKLKKLGQEENFFYEYKILII